MAAGCVSGGDAGGGGSGSERASGGAPVRGAVHDLAGVEPQVPGGRRGAAVAGCWAAAAAAESGGAGAGVGDCRGEALATGRRQSPDPGCAEALLWARDFGDHGTAGAEAGRAGSAAGQGAGQASAATAALRACRAEPVVAVGPVHVPAPEARAGVRGGVPGRSLALSGESGTGASSEEQSGAGGAGPRHRRVRRTAGDPDRPGPAVHQLARQHRVRGRAQASWHPACEEPAASSADLRQDRALLEDAVGGAAQLHGVCRLHRLRAAYRAVHPALQLPASASGARRAGAGGSVLPGGGTGARGSRGDRGGERTAPGA